MAYYGNAPADVALVVGSDVITTTEIQDATIATADIANDAITAIKIDDDGTGFQMGSLGLGGAVSGSEKLTVTGTASFSGDITGTLATASQGNITSVGTLTSLTSSGAITTSGNISTSGTGTITSASSLIAEGTLYVGENIRHTGDTNIYINFTEDTQKFYTDNSVALTIDSSQNATFAGNVTVSDRVVGSGDLILVTTDSNEKIHMDSDGYMKFETNGTEKMRILSSGHIGFGSSDPFTAGWTGERSFEFKGDNTHINLRGNQSGTTATYAGIWFNDADNITIGDDPRGVGLRATHDGSADSAKFSVLTRKTGTGGATEALTIDSNQNSTFSGVVSGKADGTASAPSYTFTGDTNTGMYRGGADQLNFTTAGSERFQIDSSGNHYFYGGNTTFAGKITPNKGIYRTYRSGWISSGSGISFDITDYVGAYHLMAQIMVLEYPSGNGAVWNVNNHSGTKMHSIAGGGVGTTSAIDNGFFVFSQMGTDTSLAQPSSGKVAIGLQQHNQNSNHPKIFIENNYGNERIIQISFYNFEG